MELKEIQNLIKFVSKSGASEVKLESGDFKITIRTGKGEPKGKPTVIQQVPMAPQSGGQPVPAATEASAQAAAPAEQKPAETIVEGSKHVTVKSPMIGTFYRKASPDKPAFVKVGASVKEGDPLCVIEAMKLFNEIESEISGTIVKVLVDDASPVEFDQPLFLIDPS